MTQPSIPIPFAIEQEVWWPGTGYTTFMEKCPECDGTKAITMTFGNGDTCSLDCRACSLGYDPPTGMIKRVVYNHKPEVFVCRTVSVESDRITYTGDHTGRVDATKLFLTESGCQIQCNIMNKQRAMDEESITIRNLESKRRDLAWSAHYWSRKRSDLKKELATVEKRLAACKEKESQVMKRPHWKHTATRCAELGCERQRRKMWTHCGIHFKLGRTLKGYRKPRKLEASA